MSASFRYWLDPYKPPISLNAFFNLDPVGAALVLKDNKN